jgi:hypothetical protein
LLDLELQYLTELDIDFDVTVTGFELPEIDLLMGELLNANENDPADAIVEVQSGPPLTAQFLAHERGYIGDRFIL